MNTNWRNRPTPVDEIPVDVDWIIAIDESGSSDLKYLYKLKERGDCPKEGEKYFTVTACAIRRQDFEVTRDKVMQLKNRYWTNGFFQYNGIEKRVCLHSKDIRERKSAFSPAVIDYNSFINDLSAMIEVLPVTLFSAHINKWKHINKYKFADEPYDLCMDFVLERIARSIGENESCYIVLESIGKREDKHLLEIIKRILKFGNGYQKSELFSKIKGVYFNPKWCKNSFDKKSYWELEIADLCAFPIHKYLSYGTKDQAFEIINKKLYGYPHIRGYGLKSFP